MKIVIVGKGPWAKGLYKIFEKNHDTILKIRKNSEKPEGYKAINSYSQITTKPDYLIFCVDSNSLVDAVSEYISEGKFKDLEIIIASKGLDNSKYDFMHLTLLQKGIDASFISGPNFASEIGNSESASMIASSSIEKANRISRDLSSEELVFEGTEDLIGVQICGAYKNICAIYFGYLNAKKETENFKAKILTEALKELAFIITKLGGNYKTAYSYSGMGDLVLSCYSSKSRNFLLGSSLTKENHDEIDRSKLYEGIYASKSLSILCEEFYGELEILQQVVRLISKRL